MSTVTEDKSTAKAGAAVLLAAGRGSRMGRSKGLLPWGDRTLIEAWVARFRAAGIEHIAVVLGADAAVVRAQLDQLDVTWAVNPEPDATGPRESLLVGLDALAADGAAWFTPIDVPVVGPTVLTRMQRAWVTARETDPDGPGPLAVLPSYRRRTGHPVLAGADFIAHLWTGERGDQIDELLGWATRRQVIVELDDVRVVGNMNRPRDYEAFAPPAGAAWDWTEEARPSDESTATLDLSTTMPGIAATKIEPDE